MNLTSNIVADYAREAEVDYVGLWQIVGRVKYDLGQPDAETLRTAVYEVVRGLLDKKLRPGDLLPSGFRPWPPMSADETIARIDREWQAQGTDPTLADPICWFRLER